MRKKAYHGGAFFGAIGEDFSMLEREKSVVSADVLDAWFDPSPNVLKKIKDHLAFAIKTSPPTQCEGLIATIAKKRGIPCASIIVAGGSSDIMFIVFQQVLKKGDRVLILDPMYGEYAHLFKNVFDVKLFRHKLHSSKQFRISPSDLLDEVDCIKPHVIVLVNPNSPTGQYLSKKDMVTIIRRIPKKTLIVVDETYIDYVGKKHSLEKMVQDFPNLVIIKSMSKVYALSGARVGYLVAQPIITDRIAPFVPPWSVSLVGQIAGVEALKDEAYYKRQYTQTHKLREEMLQDLEAIPSIEVFSSVANFFLIRLISPSLSAEKIITKLREQKIYLRDCRSMSVQMKDRFMRVSVKDRITNKRILTALKKLL